MTETAAALLSLLVLSASAAGGQHGRWRLGRRCGGRRCAPPAMTYVMLLLLQLAYSGLATVQSSLMPYGTDGALFVEQHPSSFRLLTSNATCDDFVYRQARQYVATRHAALQEAVRRVSTAVLQGANLEVTDDGSRRNNGGVHGVVTSPWLLNDVVTAVWLLAEHDVRVMETSLTIRAPGGGKTTVGTGSAGINPGDNTGRSNTSPTPAAMVYARVQRGTNGSLHLFKNWEQTCQINGTTNHASPRGELHFRSTVDCFSELHKTMLFRDTDSTGSSSGSWESMTPPGRYWHVFCPDPAEPAVVRSAMFVYDLIDPAPSLDGNYSDSSSVLRGTMTVTLDLSGEQLNQCNIPSSSSDLSPLRHKCRPSTRCVNTGTEKEGLRLGAYTCLCKPGRTFPDQLGENVTRTSFSGLQAEKEYHRHQQGLANTYVTSYDCLPCHKSCDWPFCIGDTTCSLLVDLEYRIPILAITMVTMVGVLVLMALTFKYRNDKMMRASSPGLLSVTLIGTFLLYAEVLVAAFQATHVTCMLIPWIRHVGFSLAYGGMLFKTWRISIIMRVFKSRAFKTRDSALYKKVALMTSSWIIFLISWTVIDPLVPLPVEGQVTMCNNNTWSYVGLGGEIALLLWGAYLCYQARKAPNLYNETRQVSYAIWNESIWEVFLILARFLLHFHPDPNILLLVRFLRTQLTVSTLLLLIYTPKFIIMFRKIRQVHGTLTDVYGSRRVHRLSLMVNKHGDIKTIYCTPCGPLAYIDQSEESDSSRDSHNQNAKEDEYSKAEVDSLIELVSRLKSERELYKMQVKRLLQLLRTTKRPPNGLSPALVAEDPEGNRRTLEFPDCDDQAYSDDVHTREPSGADLEEAQFFQCTASSGPRSSRASTVTTFVSSSTADDASLTEQNRVVEGAAFPPAVPLECDVLVATHGGLDSSSPSPTRKNCNGGTIAGSNTNGNNAAVGRNGISRYALTVLTRKLAQNHVIPSSRELSSSPEVDPLEQDFPRMLHSHEETCNNNRVSMRDFIPTVYGEFCDTLLGRQQARELHELAPSVHRPRVGHQRTLSSGSGGGEVGTRRQKTTSTEKLNFIMYI